MTTRFDSYSKPCFSNWSDQYFVHKRTWLGMQTVLQIKELIWSQMEPVSFDYDSDYNEMALTRPGFEELQAIPAERDKYVMTYLYSVAAKHSWQLVCEISDYLATNPEMPVRFEQSRVLVDAMFNAYRMRNEYYDAGGYNHIEFDTHLSIEEVYFAIARYFDMPFPHGNCNKEYALNNLPYLVNEFWDDDSYEATDWAYRLYVPFSGPAPEWVHAVAHCVPSYRFMDTTDDRYEDMVGYHETEITRQRSRRYA